MLDALDQPGVTGRAEPMLWGNTVAPQVVVAVHRVHAVEQRDAERRVASAASWKVSTMSAQAFGVLGVGTEPPPDSTLPVGVGHLAGSSETSALSALIIRPTFSASDIRPRRSATRTAVGWLGSGTAAVVLTGGGVGWSSAAGQRTARDRDECSTDHGSLLAEIKKLVGST